MKKYAVGHKNPDTDSIISAIGYSFIEDGFIPARTGEINKETQFVLQKFGFDVPVLIPSEEKQVCLLDHNSPEEMHEKINKEEIIGIVDHHRLGAPVTEGPLEVFMKPYGSTSTIVALIAKGHGKNLQKNEAGLLLSGIISDTLNFTSPTTTEKDREIAKDLNSIAEVDMDELAEEMFAAKSDISDIKTEELINKDYKIFEMSGTKIGIGVWETTNPESVIERKNEIGKLLKEKKQQEGLDYILFSAVDIVSGATHFILDSDPEIALVADVFGAITKGGVALAEEIVSRKKQIVPPLEKHFSK